MKIAVIGIGYVGLPLSVHFSEKYKVVAYDIDGDKVQRFLSGIDLTAEVGDHVLQVALGNNLTITSDQNLLKGSDIFIVTVPTPVDAANIPDLDPLIKACETVGLFLQKSGTVVFESTVYPGLTEEVCVKLLEKNSRLKYIEDFNVGYSPERINPGDKKNSFLNIQKIVSASTPKALKLLVDLYASIIKADVIPVSSIRVAEAAKIIENTQRDINIAFMNELSIIFNKLNIDTNEVLKVAKTKWNFLDFKPGLVGGHCIGVDPYYLTHKCRQIGYEPQIILSGRRVNDGMPSYIVNQIIKKMICKDKVFRDILIIGATFKENCNDTRNSKVESIFTELKALEINVKVYDPLVSLIDGSKIYGNNFIDCLGNVMYDCIIYSVPHDVLKNKICDVITSNLNIGGLFVDIKGAAGKVNSVDTWSL